MIKALLAIWNKYIKPFLQDPLFLGKWHEPDLLGHPDPDRITDRVNMGYKTLVGRNDYIGDTYMFEQDMSQLIMPLSRRAHATQYAARLEPTSATALQQTIARALGNTSGRGDLSDALSDFIQRATQSLFHHGKATFEIGCKKDDVGNITELYFYYVYPPSVKRFLWQYWQPINWNVAKQHHIKAGIHRIPNERMLYIKFPNMLGGRNKLRRLLHELTFMSREPLPKFQLKAMEEQANIGFNFNEFTWDKYITKGNLTRTFGWNQRKIPDNDMLEYYTVHRHLIFKRSQAVIREHIINEINHTLSGKYLNSGVQIVTDDLPTPNQLDEELAILRKGNLKFSEIFERTND